MTDDLHSLAAAYVLDALDDDERRRFDDHLESCDDCAADVVDLREAAALLAADAPVVAPPPELKSAVMSQIAATPQLAAVEPAPTAGSDGGADASTLTTTATARRRTGPPRWVTLAAAAVVVAVVGVGVIALGGDDEPAPDPTELALDEVREAPDAVTVQLRGDRPGDVTVTYSPTEELGVLVADGLDAPDPDRVYQLWAISGDEPTPSVVFTPGDGVATEEIDLAIDAPDVWAVTVEPAGGSAAPTGEIVFQGTTA